MRLNGKFVTKPSFEDFVRHLTEYSGDQLHVAAPAVVQSYDPVRGTVAVQWVNNLRRPDGSVVPVPALLEDVVVVRLQGGGVHVAFPIAKGDECLLVFGDFNIDAWYAYGGPQEALDARQHDLSDAFAIVGPNSLKNPLATALGPTEGGIATATAKVAIDALTGLIAVKNGPAPTNSLLGILLSVLTPLSVDTNVLPATKAAALAAIPLLEALLTP